MIINTDAIESLINNTAIPAYSLQQVLEISRTTIGNYRAGTADFLNMSLKNAIKIQEYIDSGNYKISYDYDGMIAEMEEDYDDLDEWILVVRTYSGIMNYGIIIDYMNVEYFKESENVDDDLKIEYCRKDLVLQEMKEKTSII